jgi:NAD(P)H dehydrogenase (quinone)
LVVVAHPSPQSFSHALADRAAATLRRSGFAPVVHDLYAEGFDPVQRSGEAGLAGAAAAADPLVERHCAELARAERIVICHPNWWGQPPAMLKGWIDRVFRLGVAYGYPEGVGFDGVPVGLLRADCALIFNTSNTPPEREAAVFGDPLDTIWRRCVFDLCGVSTVVRRCYGPMAGSTAAQRQTWLDEAAGLVSGAPAG